MDFILKALGALALVLFISTIGGTVVWAAWDSLSVCFPAASIPTEISLWTAIKLSWLAGVLIKGQSSMSSK